MKIALRFALAYIAIAGVYIIVSDWLVLALSHDTEALTRWQHAKGLTFVALSGLMMFGAIYYYVRSQDRAKRQLEEARQSFEQLFLRSPIPAVVYDTKTLRFLAVNNATAAEYGYAIEEFSQLKATDLCRPEDIEKLVSHISRISGAYGGIWTQQRKDGSTFETEIVSHPTIFRGAPARLVTARNISTFQRIEKVLAEAQAVRGEAAEAKSRFLSTISHEMRTPLNGITGCLELMEAEMDTERRRDLVETALKSADQLGTLQERLIQAATVSSKPVRPKPTNIELEPFLQRIVTSFEPLAARKGIKFKLKLNDYLPNRLPLHTGWVEDTLQILIENSVKFSDGGTVEISAKEDAAGSLQIAISDEGIGITEAEQPKIFDSFYQTDQSTSRKHGGLGLGLFVARQLCELMDASLAVHSSPETGSTFVITFSPDGARE